MAGEKGRMPRLTHSTEDGPRYGSIRDRFRDGPGMRELVDAGEIDKEAHDRAARLRESGPPTVDHETLTEIGGALRQARERAGLSLAEVTLRSGIDAPALSRIENGLNPNPTLATLSRYAQALGKRLHWTLGD